MKNDSSVPKDLSNPPRDWTPLPVEHLPAPTFWPAGFALATTFIFWGLITSWVVLATGLVIFVGSLAGWIHDIRHERNSHQ